MRAASSQTVRLERGARSTHHVAWRGVRSQRRARPPPPRRCGRRARGPWGHNGRPCNEALPAETWDNRSRIGQAARACLDIATLRGPGDGQERGGPTAGGLATRHCGRRLGATVRRLGTRCGHVWASRRCAALATGEKGVGPRRADGQRSVAGRESGTRFANWACGACTFGRRGAAQECGRPRRRNPQNWSEVREARYVARHTAHLERRARGNAPQNRWRRARNAWAHNGWPGSEALPTEISGNRFATWARGTGIVGRRGTAQ